MIKTKTKNGYTITCTELFPDATFQSTFNDVISICAPELKVGIDLFMAIDTAMIWADESEMFEGFSPYWNKREFSSLNDEVEPHVVLAVVLEAIGLLRSFIEDCFQPLSSDASEKHTA